MSRLIDRHNDDVVTRWLTKVTVLLLLSSMGSAPRMGATNRCFCQVFGKGGELTHV